MGRTLHIILLALLFTLPAMSLSAVERGLGNVARTALAEYDNTLANKKSYENQKESVLSHLREQAFSSENEQDQFAYMWSLYKEYIDYQSDSALVYAQRMRNLAKSMGDTGRQQLSYIALMKCYTTSGVLMEADHYRQMIDESQILPENIGFYWYAMQNLQERAESYASKYSELLPEKIENRLQLLMKVIETTPNESFENQFSRYQLECLQGASAEKRIKMLEDMIDKDFSPRSNAIIYFDLAKAYSDDIDKQVEYFAKSGICDVVSCTRETAAACALARLMATLGESERAFSYITVAHDDAQQYNNIIRHGEVDKVLPVITNERYEMQRSNRTLIFYFLLLVVISAMLLGFLLYKINKKNKKLEFAMDELRVKQNELEGLAKSQNELNEQLKEANEIKDTFIRQSLYVSMDFVNDVENRCGEIMRKVKAQDYSSLKFIPYNMGIKEERRRLLRNFDHAFLKLFPNFIEQFNRLFPEDKQHMLGKDNELPPDVRIFALLRIGISDTQAVASFLNISPQSVYVYKTRVKSQSLVTNSEFEAKVMEIH